MADFLSFGSLRHTHRTQIHSLKYTHTYTLPHTHMPTKSDTHTAHASHTFHTQYTYITHAQTTHKSHTHATQFTQIMYLYWKYFQLKLLFLQKVNLSSFQSLHCVFTCFWTQAQDLIFATAFSNWWDLSPYLCQWHTTDYTSSIIHKMATNICEVLPSCCTLGSVLYLYDFI